MDLISKFLHAHAIRSTAPSQFGGCYQQLQTSKHESMAWWWKLIIEN